MKVSRAALLTGSLVVFACASAGAHTTSTALASVTVDGPTVTYRLTLVPSELPDASKGPFVAAAGGDAITAAAAVEPLRERVAVRADGERCSPGRASAQGSALADGRLTITLTYRCPRPPARLTLRDDSFDLFGEHHRTLARIEMSGAVMEAAFLPDAREVIVGRGPVSASTPNFVWLGVEHIATGWDHLLFLAALLLGGGGALALLKMVTAFTVAHSASLAAAVLHLVHLSERLVETVIAASIAWVAIDNVVRRGRTRQRWVTTFVFGLVHGIGFASVLTPLALPPRSLVVALIGFNAGVEAGQAAAIALALPIVVWMRGKPWEAHVLRAASIVVAAVGIAWCVHRLLG